MRKIINKIPTIEEFWDKNKGKIYSNDFITLWITILVGCITNLGLIINQVTNPDGILANKYNGYFLWDIATGRWATRYIYALRSNLTLPIYTTILSIFIFSISIVLIINLLEINNIIYSIVAGILLITFPSLSQMLTYFYMSDTFAFSMFFAVVSVYALTKIKNQGVAFGVGIVCMIMSMSIYQAFIGISVGLCLSVIVIKVLNHPEETSKKIFGEAVIYIVAGVVALILYFVLSKGICFIHGIEMADYRGINSALSFGLTNIYEMFLNAYKTFFDFYFTDKYYSNSQWSTNILFLLLITLAVCMILIIIFDSIKTREYCRKEKKYRIAIIVICIIIFPVAYTCIAMIATNTTVDFKMLPQMMLPIVTIITILQNKVIAKKSLFQWICTSLVVLICLKNIMINNAIFEAMKVRFDMQYSLSTRVVNTIENYEGYSRDKKVVILGDVTYEQSMIQYQKFWELAKADVTQWGQVWSSSQNAYQYSWYYYLLTYHGIMMNIATDEEIRSIMDSQEFKEMGNYPGRNCIQEINGIIVVKLSDMNI